MSKLHRRRFLQNGLLAAGGVITARYAFGAQAQTDARLVCILLRGALDGLAAVPPYGDADYAKLRRELAIAAPGAENGALKLDGMFGLNPGLKFLHESYQARELLVLHAAASPYRDRSHFDGQDALENGTPVAHALSTGWLNRSLAAMPAGGQRGRESGVALGQNLPLMMRGPAPVASWSPSTMPDLDEDTLQRIADRYSSDPLLGARLADALANQQMADAGTAEAAAAGAAAAGAAPQMTQAQGARPRAAYTETVRMAATFLKRPDGPAVAMFDTTGWDTHANEGGAVGQLTTRLTALDQALRTMKDSLGPVWSRTAVIIVTEFGRTAAANGTRGTDHGTGAAAFVLGGAVAGGRVISDWPGLSNAALYQGRDLKPTTDLRTVFKGVLHDHMQLSTAALDRDVFPDSAHVKAMGGLLRG